MNGSIRLLVADDHEIIRLGIRSTLEEDGHQVCAEAGDGREAVRLAVELAPDVAILDLTMPELNGLEATRQIRHAQPHTEILIFSMHESDEAIRQALLAGARGYLVKSDPCGHVVAAVEALSRRKPFFTGKVSETVLTAYLGDGPFRRDAAPVGGLTPREREVLQLLAEGRSNRRIAVSLGIGVKTVETHRAAIMRKLDVSSVTTLVRYAVRNGLAMP